MDNNAQNALGQDLEVQVAPQPTDYAPEATIVYNASTSYYGAVEPKIAAAYEVSGTFRNSEVRTQQVISLNNRISDAETILKDAIAEGPDDETVSLIKEIAQALGITLTRTLSITAVVEHTITVEIEYGDDEPSQWDFNAEVSIDGYSVEDSSHYVRSFDVSDEE